MSTQQFTIIGSQSSIEWIGRKITGAHHGTIALKEGTLVFAGEALVGGRFVIDTRSIAVVDITDPETNAYLAGHLASEDFFGSERYPEALFEIRQAEPRPGGAYRIDGELTIKGITHPVGFDAQVRRSGNTVAATGNITVDRTKYGIRYGSGTFFTNLGDNLIYNNFDLATSITAEAVAAPVEA